MSKFLALTLATLIGSTTIAAAESTFSLPQVQGDDSIVELGLKAPPLVRHSGVR
jgi:hypothetical protein